MADQADHLAFGNVERKILDHSLAASLYGKTDLDVIECDETCHATIPAAGRYASGRLPTLSKTHLEQVWPIWEADPPKPARLY